MVAARIQIWDFLHGTYKKYWRIEKKPKQEKAEVIRSAIAQGDLKR